MISLSVLISVYKKDKDVYLRLALDSLVNQTLQPDEIVLVKDGPLTVELESVISQYQKKYPKLFNVIALPENKGLGNSLNIGLRKCKGELVARMDSDDICKLNRFEIQLNHLVKHPEISALGNSIEEFFEVPGDLNSFRKLPLTHLELQHFANLRNPLNHPTVMFRKDHVLSVGSYESVLLFEDYYLWLKLIKNDYKLANLEDTLLYFRSGDINMMLKRRHGLGYLVKEINFYKKAYADGLISFFSFLKASLLRTPVRIMPIWVLRFVYKILRNKK